MIHDLFPDGVQAFRTFNKRRASGANV